MIYFLTALPNLKTGLPFEYGALPILACIYYSITLHQTKTWTEGVLFILGFLCFFAGLLAQNIDAFKELFFVLYIITGLRLVISGKISEKVITNTLYFWIVVGILEYIPAFYDLKAALMTKSLAPGVVRGGSSMATEPSYFALTIGCLFIIHLTLRNFRKFTFRTGAIYLFAFLITKSTMALLFIPLLILTTEKSYAIGLLLPIIVFLNWDTFSSSRYIRLFLFLSENSSGQGVYADASAGSRLLFIIKDLKVSLSVYLLPPGPGSYETVMKLTNASELVSKDAITNYDFQMSGSLWGRFLVNYGILLTFFAIYFLHLLVRKGRAVGLMIWLTVLLVGLQMISLISPAFPLMIGILLAKCRRSYV